MIDDLRHHRAPDAFQIITEEAAGWLLVAFLFAAFICDRMGWAA